MNARTVPAGQAKAVAAPPRFDAKFIEDHKLIERYLENKLPLRGARDLENWCRAHPDYLNDLKLAERAQASLKLLEASGQSQDLREPPPPWWRSPYVPIAAAAVAFVSLLGFWTMVGKYSLLHSELEDTKVRMSRGSLVQPTVSTEQYVSPDRAPGVDHARIIVSSAAPQLIDLHIDMSYTKKLMQFKVTVDKEGQGRALIMNNVLKDSNNEIRLTFNTTGIAVGRYSVRIDSVPMSGPPTEEGWLLLDVQ
jgi:hypothetical protein